MFANLLWFEVKNRLARRTSLVFFLVYFALAFMIAITFGGAFKGVSVSFGMSNKLAMNSPVALNFFMALLGYMGILVTAPVFGQAVNQDFENGFQQILFSSPIRKSTYFGVRYLGSTLAILAILSSAAWGVWLATLMPFVDRNLVATNHLWYYVAPYLVTIVPNTLIFGAVFMALVAWTKKMAPVYIANVGVFTGWLIAQAITGDLENKKLASIIEPFGLEASSQVIRYWSIAQQNSQVVGLTGPLLWNRLAWGALGLAFLIGGYVGFNPFRLAREKRAKASAAKSSPSVSATPALTAPSALLQPHALRVLWALSVSEFKQAFSNLYFLVLLGCGVLYVFSVSGQVGKIFGTETLPVTYHVLEVIGGQFSIFVVALIAFYSGELVWKDRDCHFHELVDAKPVSNLYLYLSKLFSLFLLQILLLGVVFVCCVIIQAAKGYTHFEWNLYAKYLLLYTLPVRLLTCVLAMFIQTVARSRHFGRAIILLFYIVLIFVPQMGFNHSLYLINRAAWAEYSDMNGFGTSFLSFASHWVYWAFFELGLALLTLMLWTRGAEGSWADRCREAKRRLRGPYSAWTTVAALGFVASGAWIFYNTNILHDYHQPDYNERSQVEYEKLYKQYERVPHPEIFSADLAVDLFPKTQSMKTVGKFRYRNRSPQPIASFMLITPVHPKVLNFTQLEWSRPATIIERNDRVGVTRYQLATPLAPGEELDLKFALDLTPHGFENDEFSKAVVENGTFFNNLSYFPSVGYNGNGEIGSDKTRHKYGLADRPRAHPLDDEWARSQNDISAEGSWIDLHTTVSTDPDQIAIAPGYPEKEWTDNGRRYFSYRMDRPILNFYAILSGRYAVTRDHWEGPQGPVNIEIYHHPQHTADVARMIDSVKKSLDYYTKNFSPYQYRQVRIMEFPRYATFAQSFPNTVPFSEGIGFIARIRPPVAGKPDEDIDYPFYVTAHEMGHQWWGHQVVGANVQGLGMLMESMAQYSALMVQKKEFGAAHMRKFLRYELDRYLFGRSQEAHGEQPLIRTEDQSYIHYRKGSVAFYALQDAVGEATVNRVLKDYIHDVAYQNAPFTRSIDLTARLKAALPADQKHWVEDLLETITLYDDRTEEATYTPVAGKAGHYAVEIKALTRKLRANELGEEHEVPMNDELDVGVFDEKGDPLALDRKVIHSGENVFKLEVAGKPAKAGVDPYNKMIDRVPEDNQIRVTAAPTN